MADPNIVVVVIIIIIVVVVVAIIDIINKTINNHKQFIKPIYSQSTNNHVPLIFDCFILITSDNYVVFGVFNGGYYFFRSITLTESPVKSPWLPCLRCLCGQHHLTHGRQHVLLQALQHLAHGERGIAGRVHLGEKWESKREIMAGWWLMMFN